MIVLPDFPGTPGPTVALHSDDDVPPIDFVNDADATVVTDNSATDTTITEDSTNAERQTL